MHRAGVVVLGVLLVLAGIVMSGPGVPGPGIVTIFVGLAFLALEFDRAERLLERVIIWGERAAERAEQTTPRQRDGRGVAFLVALGVFAWAALTYDIPLVPVPLGGRREPLPLALPLAQLDRRILPVSVFGQVVDELDLARVGVRRVAVAHEALDLVRQSRRSARGPRRAR